MSGPQRGELSTLLTVHGTTQRAGSAAERTRFQAFKEFFIPRLARQEQFAVAYEEATVRKLDAEGEKLVQEAAKLSAERDVAKQEELRIFCETVDKSFAPDDSPHVVKLKLAKLLETNPQIANQLEKVNEIIDSLNRSKGCLISIEGPSEKID